VREVWELGRALQGSAHLLQEREAERDVLLAQAEIARGEAEAANRAKDDFLATLSHELRSPLSAMLGWVRMLRTGRLTTEQTTRALEVIERNVHLQTRVINDLLDVSRIVAGKLRLDRHPTDVQPTVQQALEQVRHQAESKGVTLVTTTPNVPAIVDGDEARLVQIVANLLSNAVKFTPEGGRVAVDVGVTRETVTIAVSDTGPGIAPSILPYIFERFRQGESGAGVRGLGLGLAIVRNLAELHGGRVAATSLEGGGARFVVTLPRSAVRDEAPPAPSSRRMPRPGLRVLVVEDEAESLDLIVTILRRQGLEAMGVGSVDEALAVWGTGKFDALVSDIRMPGRDGYELVAEIRQKENGGPHVRAVAVSANAATQDKERAQTAGFDVHLSKPFDPDDLLAALA
jgi:CheY-like chemotaxis protein/nitrogen-specific signal transduction histidine kinase